MSKPFSEAPIVSLQELMSPQAPALLARMALASGPVLRWTVPVGQRAGKEAVFLVGPEANRFVLHTHREYLSQEQGWTPYIGNVMGKGLLNMDPPEHTLHRKLWNPAFTNAYMEHYVSLIQQVIADYATRWAEQDMIDLYAEARSITCQVAISVLAGLERGPQVEHVQGLFFTIMAVANPDPRGYEQRLARAMEARTELDGIFRHLITEERARSANTTPRDVLGAIVHARDEGGQTLTDEQIIGHLNILLLAGHETTAVLSTFVLYLLTTLPEQRQRVEQELQALLGDSTDPITMDEARQMKVLDGFIKEAGRLYSPVFTVPRMVVHDVEFAGYILPVGTYVHLAIGAGHHLPTVFENPEVFDTDRYAPPREEDRRTPYGLVPFGSGARLCIGINFANTELKMLVAHLLRFYRMELTTDQPPYQMGLIGTGIYNNVSMRVTTLPSSKLVSSKQA